MSDFGFPLVSNLGEKADDAFWDRMLDDKSLSFVLMDGNGTIVAVQTVKIAHTVCEDPVFYVALVAQSEMMVGPPSVRAGALTKNPQNTLSPEGFR